MSDFRLSLTSFFVSDDMKFALEPVVSDVIRVVQGTVVKHVKKDGSDGDAAPAANLLTLAKTPILLIGMDQGSSGMGAASYLSNNGSAMMSPGMGMMPPPPHAAGDESDVEEDQGPAPGASSARASVPAGAAAGVLADHDPPAIAAQLPEDGQYHHQRQPADALISRSCTYVKQLPRNRLSETLEAVAPMLDSTFTSELSLNGLLMLLWLFCRVKPAVKISDLRDLVCLNRLCFL